MNIVTIKRAKDGYVIETEDALPQIARNLPEALVITARAFEGEEYLPTRVGKTIILTSSEEEITG